MGEQLPCPYPDTVDNTRNCEFTTDSMDLLKMYKRAKHNGPKEIINMVKETAKAKVKGFESKPTRFVEDKMREGFKRCPYRVTTQTTKYCEYATTNMGMLIFIFI